MSTKIIVAIVLVPALLLGLLLTADYVVLDVREGGPDGHHFVVPVPLFAAKIATRWGPDEARYVEVPDLERYLPALERAIGELRGVGDEVLVSVEDGDEKVVVAKAGDALTVDVNDGVDEEVHVTLPLDTVLDVLATYDGRGFATGDMLRALGAAGSGKLIHVRDGGDEVKVWIW